MFPILIALAMSSQQLDQLPRLVKKQRDIALTQVSYDQVSYDVGLADLAHIYADLALLKQWHAGADGAIRIYLDALIDQQERYRQNKEKHVLETATLLERIRLNSTKANKPLRP